MKVLKIRECIPNLTNMMAVQWQGEVLIDSNFVENYFLKKYGEWYTINNSYNGLLSDFQYYNLNKVEDLKRMLDAYFSEYKPLDNYNGTETITESYGKQKETNIDGERVDTNVIGNEQSTSTDSVTSFETTNFSETGKNITTNDSRTDSATKGSQTNTRENDAYENTIITTKSGNLGVTTSQQMIESEISMRLKMNVKERYLDEFIAEWCYLVD